ncbi:MAG: diguanylate cyclase [Planctomycetota bacterium]|jgi:diguanylate cyclase (GGDEF)-like protein/putative nucleotidyltransferase with HDIG domain
MEENAERPAKIVAISPDATVKSAAIMMFSNKIGCLIVNDQNEKFSGIVTERDVVSRAVASSMDLEKTTITEIMTPRVVSCPVGTPASKAREIMAANGIRHLPVVDNGVVVGILSARDLMGQQLLEDRAAAEEVAMLANCLKSIELNEAADIVTKEVPKLFQATNCVLCLYKEGPDAKNAAATESPALVSYNECPCPREHLKHPADNSELFDESGFYCDSIPEDCEKAGAQGPRSVIPLSISGLNQDPKEKLSGYLCMCGLAHWSTLNRELTSYKAKLTREILTSHLTNASLYHQARLTSLTDALTAVGSRRLLEDKLEAECARAKRYKRPFSVAIIDLDNFKTINDVFGHATGDDALKKLAGCMKSQKRTPDILARYGGDEFVILMPETKANDAVTLLERIREKIQQIEVAENISMTISCGIARSSPDQDDSSSEVIRRADLALYEAKSAGRNCVKVWNETMSKTLKASDIEVEKIKKLKRRIAGMSEQAEKVFIQSIWGLVQALEAKDPYAKKHSENVMHYAAGIAEIMNTTPKQLDVIRRAAMIHDIGRIGVPDAILSKPGTLTPHERSIIEQHPLIAVRILDKMSFLEQEIAIVRSHHERWNGRGYPDGLSNVSIPLGARILAVADTFDALTSNRSYRDSRSLAEAVKILVDSSGYDFDPKAVEAMVSWVRKVRGQLDNVDQLTPEDLLDSQKQLDHSSMAELVADTCGAER